MAFFESRERGEAYCFLPDQISRQTLQRCFSTDRGFNEGNIRGRGWLSRNRGCRGCRGRRPLHSPRSRYFELLLIVASYKWIETRNKSLTRASFNWTAHVRYDEQKQPFNFIFSASSPIKGTSITSVRIAARRIPDIALAFGRAALEAEEADILL